MKKKSADSLSICVLIMLHSAIVSPQYVRMITLVALNACLLIVLSIKKKPNCEWNNSLIRKLASDGLKCNIHTVVDLCSAKCGSFNKTFAIKRRSWSFHANRKQVAQIVSAPSVEP